MPLHSEEEEDVCDECGRSEVYEQTRYCFRCLVVGGCLEEVLDPIDQAAHRLFELSQKDEPKYGPIYESYLTLHKRMFLARDIFLSNASIHKNHSFLPWRLLHGLMEEAKERLAPYARDTEESYFSDE